MIRAAFSGSVGAFQLDAAFAVPAIGVTALFGPSGCGKTTVLRCMAGLHRFTQGRCEIAGEVWQDQTSFVPPHRRSIGYVFQEASLFAHLSVKRNLLFGAPRRRDGAIAFDDVIALLGLEALLGRAPHHLSGGERQRVAIGRALLSQPRLLLMDEPLSALDSASRDEILPFLERLRDRLSLPMVYVSHDMKEVERLADTLVLMAAGRVLATGRLSELQSDDQLPLAAEREAAVSVDGVVAGFDPEYGLLTVDVAGGVFVVPSPFVAPGARRRLRIAARDVSITRDPVVSTILNVLPARILSASPEGDFEFVVVLGLGVGGAGARLLARVTRKSWQRLALTVPANVNIQVKAVALT